MSILTGKQIAIEVLDDGFVLTEAGKSRAVESKTSVQNIVIDSLKSLMQYLDRPSTNDMTITINVEINVPKNIEG